MTRLTNINFQQTAVATRSHISDILERSKLSRLPKLDLLERNRLATFSTCVVCKSSLKNEKEFSQLIGVCQKCLNLYQVIDSQINAVAEKKSLEMKRRKFTEKLKF